LKFPDASTGNLVGVTDRLRSAATIFGVWTLVGLLTTEFAGLAIERTGAQAPWSTMLWANLISVWLWAAFTPGMIYLARRVWVAEQGWRTALPPHLFGALAFALADVLLERAIWAVLPQPAPPADMVVLFLRRLFPNTLCYAVVVAIATAGRYARLSQVRAATAERLQGQLTAARLQALQAQLRPHFLFNTLSMIAEQAHVDPAAADRMIGRLGHLLRASLASNDRQEVTLAEELEILQSYLDIMSLRLSGRAMYEIDVRPDCRDAAVPALVLQPIVENAYRHGLERMTRDGHLSISAHCSADMLEIEVADNGAGFDPAGYREGIGLRIVRERLAELYGPRATMHLRPRVPSGTVAVLRVPYRRLSQLTRGPRHNSIALETVS
jgi:signal transduction histidine kinase